MFTTNPYLTTNPYNSTQINTRPDLDSVNQHIQEIETDIPRRPVGGLNAQANTVHNYPISRKQYADENFQNRVKSCGSTMEFIAGVLDRMMKGILDEHTPPSQRNDQLQRHEDLKSLKNEFQQLFTSVLKDIATEYGEECEILKGQGQERRPLPPDNRYRQQFESPHRPRELDSRPDYQTLNTDDIEFIQYPPIEDPQSVAGYPPPPVGYPPAGYPPPPPPPAGNPPPPPAGNPPPPPAGNPPPPPAGNPPPPPAGNPPPPPAGNPPPPPIGNPPPPPPTGKVPQPTPAGGSPSVNGQPQGGPTKNFKEELKQAVQNKKKPTAQPQSAADNAPSQKPPPPAGNPPPPPTGKTPPPTPAGGPPSVNVQLQGGHTQNFEEQLQQTPQNKKNSTTQPKQVVGGPPQKPQPPISSNLAPTKAAQPPASNPPPPPPTGKVPPPPVGGPPPPPKSNEVKAVQAGKSQGEGKTLSLAEQIQQASGQLKPQTSSPSTGVNVDPLVKELGNAFDKLNNGYFGKYLDVPDEPWDDE